MASTACQHSAHLCSTDVEGYRIRREAQRIAQAGSAQIDWALTIASRTVHAAGPALQTLHQHMGLLMAAAVSTTVCNAAAKRAALKKGHYFTDGYHRSMMQCRKTGHHSPHKGRSSLLHQGMPGRLPVGQACGMLLPLSQILRPPSLSKPLPPALPCVHQQITIQHLSLDRASA